MGLKLFTFTYNTLLQQSDNESSSLFLPKVLATMQSGGKTYLPIKVDSWNINALPSTFSDAFAITWFGPYFQNMLALSKETPNPPTVTQKMIDNAKAVVNSITSEKLTVIACPGAAPMLQVQSVEILGLSNIKAQGSPPVDVLSDKGYNSKITLDFNAYPVVGDDWNQKLELAGTEPGTDSKTQKVFSGLGFTMSQCLCFAENSDKSKCIPLPQGVDMPTSPCNPDGFTDTATGQVVITITNAKIVSDVTITVAQDKKTLVVTINELTFEAESGDYPTYKIANIGIDHTDATAAYVGPWATFITNIIGTPEAAKSFTENVTTALNSSDNIKTIESTMNTQLANALDSLLGKQQGNFSGSGGGNTNPVDQYIFNRVGGGLNNPQGDLYLPKAIIGVQSPVLEPYKTSELDISGTYSTDFMGSIKLTVSQIKLPSGLTINGLSNLIAPSDSVIFEDNAANATFELGRLNPGPSFNGKKVPNPPLKATSTFSMMVQVGNNNPVGPITGNITIKVHPQSNPTTPAVKTALNASGSDPDSLILTYTGITIEAAPGEVDVAIALSGEGSMYSPAVTAIADQDSLKSSIISALNSYIAGHLSEFSQAATTFAKNQFNNLG